MKTLVINAKANTIEMTKAFSQKAKVFNTDEYKALQEARRDYPSFKVVIAKRGTKKSTFKGLTYEFMEKYIKAHDDDRNTILKEFNTLRAKTEDAVEFGIDSLSYGEMKAWFFKKYPQIEEFQKKREAILAA